MKDKTPSLKKVNSGRAQHNLESRAEHKAHADFMNKEFGVKTVFHRSGGLNGDDDLSYRGSRNAVKKALIHHYDGDLASCMDNHSRLFR